MIRWWPRFGVIVIVASMLNFAIAQDERIEDFDFEDLPEQEVGSLYTVLGIGVVGSVQFLNTEPLQQIAQRVFPTAPPEINDPLYCTGFYFMESFFPQGANLRFGFLYLNGSRAVDRTVSLPLATPPDTVSLQRRLSYGVSYNALTVDYAWVLSPRLVIVPGVQLGWGTLWVHAAQSSKERDFSEEFQFTPPLLNSATMMEAFHFFTAVQVGIEWMPTPTALIRLAGTYHRSWAGQWEADNIGTITNVPESLNGSGFGVQVGLFIGMFRIEDATAGP